jgi:hypothetical protein
LLKAKLDPTWRYNVDQCYKTVCTFLWIVNFDYFSLLRNFDADFVEYKINIKTRWIKIKAFYVIEYLKDFLAISIGLSQDKNWKKAFAVLHEFNRKAGLQTARWQGILARIQAVLSSTIFSMVIRHAECNPYWKEAVIIPKEGIADLFIDEICNQATETINEVIITTQLSAMEKISRDVFGEGHVLNMDLLYSEEQNHVFHLSNIQGFKYVAPYKYCMMFINVFSAKISGIFNTVIIYGIWSIRNRSQGITQMLQDFTDIAEKLRSFDKTLSETEETGIILRKYRINSGRGKHHREKLQNYVDSVDDNVYDLIDSFIENLIFINNFFSDFLNQKNNPEKSDISNLPELEEIFRNNDYDIEKLEKIIHTFLKLLQFAGFIRQ